MVGTTTTYTGPAWLVDADGCYDPNVVVVLTGMPLRITDLDSDGGAAATVAFATTAGGAQYAFAVEG